MCPGCSCSQFKTFEQCCEFFGKKGDWGFNSTHNGMSIEERNYIKYDIYLRQNESKYILDLSKLDLMIALEKKYECAGMCKLGKYYYSREGTPKRTCLYYMKIELDQVFGPFAACVNFSAYLSLSLLILHLFLPSWENVENKSDIKQEFTNI